MKSKYNKKKNNNKTKKKYNKLRNKKNINKSKKNINKSKKDKKTCKKKFCQKGCSLNKRGGYGIHTEMARFVDYVGSIKNDFYGKDY